MAGRLGLAMLVISAAFASNEGLHHVAEVVQLGEGDEPVPELKVTASGYAEIPGFKFTNQATEVTVESKGECEAKCNQEPTCESYSYAKMSHECLWSTNKMQYDPDFIFSEKSSSGGSYHEFPGLVNSAGAGMIKINGRTAAQCEEACNAAVNCEAISYRARDMLCLLTGSSVGFHSEFDYFEKEGTNHKDFDERPVTTVDHEIAHTDATLDEHSQEHDIEPTSTEEHEGNSTDISARVEEVKEWANERIQKKDEEAKLKLKAEDVRDEEEFEKQKSVMNEKATEAKNKGDKIEEVSEKARQKLEKQMESEIDEEKVKFEESAATLRAKVAAVKAAEQEANTKTSEAKISVQSMIKHQQDLQGLEATEKEKAEKDAANSDLQLGLVKEKDTKREDEAIEVAVKKEMAAMLALEENAKERRIRDEKEVEAKSIVEEKERKLHRESEQKHAAEKVEKGETVVSKMQENLGIRLKDAASRKLELNSTLEESKLEVAQAQAEGESQVKSEKAQLIAAAIKAEQDAQEKREKVLDKLDARKKVLTDLAAARVEAEITAGKPKCLAELANQQAQAYTDQVETSQAASVLQGENFVEEGMKMMAENKAEWDKKINTAYRNCLPKILNFGISLLPDSVFTLTSEPQTQPADGQEIQIGNNIKIALYKFRVPLLLSNEILTRANLIYIKISGPAAPMVVTTTSCDYTETLRWETKPAILNTLSNASFVVDKGQGQASFPLESMSNYVKASQNSRHATNTICIMVSGGDVGEPVIIEDVKLKLEVRHSVESINQILLNKYPAVSLGTRRRVSIPSAAARRRSIQAIFSQGNEIGVKVELKYKPIVMEEFENRILPEKTKRMTTLENEIRAADTQVRQLEVDDDYAQEFSEQNTLAAEMVIAKNKTSTEFDTVFPERLNYAKTENKGKMIAELLAKIERDANATLKQKIIDEAAREGPVKAKAALDSRATGLCDASFQTELNNAVSQKLPEAIKTPLKVKVDLEVTSQAVDAKYKDMVTQAINKKVDSEREAVTSLAAEKAINERVEQNYQNAISEAVETEKRERPTSALATELAAGGLKESKAMATIKLGIRKEESLPDTLKTQISTAAKEDALSNLMKTVNATVEREFTNSREQIVRDLTAASDTKWRIPVENEVAEALRKEYTPIVRSACMSRARSQVYSNNALGLMTEAEIAKEEARLWKEKTPAMESEVTVLFRMNTQSKSFISSVNASDLQLEMKLKTDMYNEIFKKYENQAKSNTVAKKEEALRKIWYKVNAKNDPILQEQLNLRIKPTVIQDEVTRELRNASHLEFQLQKEKYTRALVIQNKLPQEMASAINDTYWASTFLATIDVVQQEKGTAIRATIQAETNKEIEAQIAKQLPDVVGKEEDQRRIAIMKSDLKNRVTLQLQPLVAKKVRKGVLNLATVETQKKIDEIILDYTRDLILGMNRTASESN